VPVDTHKGEQFAPGFTALNPNNKVPVITDGEAVVFDSPERPSRRPALHAG
jgi:GST-like protein